MGWIVGTLSEELLRQVVGPKTTEDVWKTLKNTFNKATVDRELTLHHNLETFGRESCDSLTDYGSKYKTICNELAAIEKPLSNDRKSFWMLNGLGLNYQMFTTMTLRPPLLKYSELLSLLHSYERRILM